MDSDTSNEDIWVDLSKFLETPHFFKPSYVAQVIGTSLLDEYFLMAQELPVA